MVRAASWLCIALLSGVAALPAPARAGIFRCTAPGGAVTYQQDACAADERSKAIEVPGSYAAPDADQRERLFRREAELDRRLEARRERESREALARSAAVAPLPQAQPVQETIVAWPLVPWPRVQRHFRAHPRPFARGMGGRS